MDTPLIFKPRRSWGWLWLALTALFYAVCAYAFIWLRNAFLPPILIVVAVFFLLMAVWFPGMRYEIHPDRVVLRYGPVVSFTIPVGEIRAMHVADLHPTLWGDMRVPGWALFTINDAGAGNVRMCATSAKNGILLIETRRGRYGITPVEVEAFIQAVDARRNGEAGA